MTSRQCEIAAEAYAASLLAQAGYDVSVQYGAHQPNYDLVANKGPLFVPVSVKGSQDGGWMLAVKYKKAGNSYHDAINLWLAAQRTDVLFMFVQFVGVAVGQLPRAYVARPPEIAAHMKPNVSVAATVLFRKTIGGIGRAQNTIIRFRPRGFFLRRVSKLLRYNKSLDASGGSVFRN